jgi:hypothetical protein
VKRRHAYPPSRSADAIRAKARAAFGRPEPEEDESEEPVSGAEMLPQPKAPQAPALKIDPLTGSVIPRSVSDGAPKLGRELLKHVQGERLAPPGTEQIDRDAATARLREEGLREPPSDGLVRRIAEDHADDGWDEGTCRAYAVLMRHSRYDRGNQLWPIVTLSEPSILWALAGRRMPPAVGSAEYAQKGYGLVNPPPNLTPDEITKAHREIERATDRLEFLGFLVWLAKPTLARIRVG